jgi:type VI secretion system secreted protein Hcp
MAADIFLDIGIEGEAKDEKFKGQIEVAGWALGMTQTGTAGAGGGAGAGKVNIQDLFITKFVDKSTPTLMEKCCSGDHCEKAVLTQRKAGGTQLEYLRVTLTKVLISSYQVSAGGGDAVPTESIGLNFSKIEYCYQEQDEKGGKAGGEVCGVWNLVSNTNS